MVKMYCAETYSGNFHTGFKHGKFVQRSWVHDILKLVKSTILFKYFHHPAADTFTKENFKKLLFLAFFEAKHFFHIPTHCVIQKLV